MTAPDSNEMSAVKRALVEIRDLRARLARAESASREPIAVIGMGCRFPGGANDPDSLWSLLERGTDAIGPVPADRWDRERFYHQDPDHPGTMVTTQGGFIDAVDRFDADFFGIAPVEAASMDPQQRILLEVAWEALERAGIAPDSLRGSPTGVFIGIGNSDYWRMLFADRSQLDAYAGSGGSYAVAAGRLSYTLGLQGPALAIDTACSASLVAIHSACQSLRSGESTLALAGGVNLILGPEAHIAFSKARMMAPDGRCKTFAASADGYGRGEGCGVVVLRRLTDAVAAGDRILAVIRGSAVNQDGRSGGLTVPNGPAQVAVIRAALAQAGLTPADVDLVEAHGTGTPLGDPIELGALATAYGEGRPASRRLLVASLKTNFGHLEAAAGIAGFIKAVMAVDRGRVPAHLHFDQPSPHVDWNALPVRVPTDREEWPDVGDRPRRAGVSSFGFSGTNAHVIVEQPPVRNDAVVPSNWILSGSARTESGLAALAERYAGAVARSVDGGAALAVASGAGRAQLRYRFAIPMTERSRVVESLNRIAAGQRPEQGRVGAAVPGQAPRVAFLFSGQGGQYPGMGAELYRTSETFKAAIDRAVQAAGEVGPTVLAALLGSPGVDLTATGIAQPALFALQYGLVALWRSWGIEPMVVAGHSIGEHAASVAAGAFELETAMAIVKARASLMQALPSGSAMLVVEASEQEVQPLLESIPELDLTGVNGARQVVIGGPIDRILAASEQLGQRQVRTHQLGVSHASHTRAMDPMLGAYTEAISTFRPSAPQIRIVSTVTGVEADASFGMPEYWARQVRSPVRFDDALTAVLAVGVTHVIEIGPHPVLLGLAAERIDSGVALLPSLRRDTPVWPELLDGLAALYADGAAIRWPAVQSGGAWRPDELPTYPFERRRYWADRVAQTAVTRVSSLARWDAAIGAAERQAEQAPLSYRVGDIGETWSVLARLTWTLAGDTLRRLGAFDEVGSAGRSVGDVLARTGIKPIYRHLVERWLVRLVDGGLLERTGDGFRPVGGTLPVVATDSIWSEVRSRLAADPALLTYLEGCGRLLPGVLTGDVSPLETLFPNGSPELAERLYAETGVMRYVNLIAAAAIEAVAARSQDGPCRILEIGAGTGGTTVAVVPRLEREQTEYWFTDVSDIFLSRAVERFGSEKPFRYATLDLDQDPAGQGFAAGSFDAILATNAVHATKDLRASLTRIRDLLAPGGVLVLVESTEHLDWFDMSTGLIEGWQHFEDDLRGDNPLLDSTQWQAALGGAGFAAVEVAPSDGSAAAAGGQRVILARAPGDRADASAVPVTASSTQPIVERKAAVSSLESPLDAVRTAPHGSREEILVGLVRGHVVRILRLEPGSEPARSDRLLDLGFDSLMAVQLRNALGAGLEIASPLPATLLFDYPTIEAIARFLLARLGLGDVGSPEVRTSVAPAAISEADLAAMTDDEVAVFLERRLGEAP